MSHYSTNDMIRLVAQMYASTNNDQRAALTTEVMNQVQKLSKSALQEVGASMMGLPDGSFGAQTVPIRSFGAVTLKRGVCEGKLNVPEDVHPGSLLSSLVFHHDHMHPLLRHSVIHLISACATRSFPERWSTLMEELCPVDIVSKPQLLPLMQQFCSACLDPSLQCDTPTQRLKILRKGLREHASSTTKRLIAAMGIWFQQGQMVNVTCGLTVLTSLSSIFVASEWWELGLHDVVSALSKSPACAKEACALGGALVRVSDQLNVNDATAMNFVDSLLRLIEPAIASNELDTVQELLDIAADIPAPVAERIQPTLVVFCLLVIQMPSVAFASLAADILRKMISTHERPVSQSLSSPDALLAASLQHIKKHMVHPSFAQTPSSRMSPDSARIQQAIGFSETQFPTLQAFDSGYADLRGALAAILGYLATAFPTHCSSFCITLLQSLPTTPYPYDNRTTVGNYVQQHSQTFSEWSAAQFVLEHLLPGALGTPGNEASASAVFQVLQSKAPPTDAVLIPTFLNMMLAFWTPSCKWSTDAQIAMWTASCRLIFSYMSLIPPNMTMVPFNHVDLISARKRAFTSFIHAAVYHGETIVRIPELRLLPLCQAKLLDHQIMISEKTLMYEAVASLSNSMEPEQQATFLDAMISPMRECVVRVDVSTFVDLLCNSKRHGDRSLFRDSVAVLASILRRCKPSRYTESLAMTIIPVMGDLLLKLHGLTADDVPVAFRSIFDLSNVDRDQFLTGSARKSSVATGLDENDVGRARSALQQIRLSLYQAMGSMGTFVALESYSSSLVMTVQHCASFKIHTMRAFTENALFRWLKCSMATASFILPAVQAFLQTQIAQSTSRSAAPGGGMSSARSAHDEVVDSKQMFHFTKDIISALISIVDTPNWFALVNIVDPVSSLLETLCYSGCDMRGVVGTIVRFIENKSLPADSCTRCFCAAARACAMANRDAANQSFVAGLLCGVYTKDLDVFSHALRQQGVADGTLVTLNATLSMSNRIDNRRKVFLEFLQQAVVPPF